MSDQENGGDQAKAERFVAFYYAEIKDLAKHFLTLISATIVLSITFADKIVPFTTATTDQKAVLIAVWIFLLASLLLTGLGLFQIFLAAEKASGSLVYDYAGDFQAIARRAYLLLDLGATTYGVALILLAITAVLRLVG